MSSGAKTVIQPVKSLDRAKALYGALLGATPEFDAPYDVQFNIGDQRLGLDPNGHTRGFPGSAGYWEVEDIIARFQELLAAGAQEHEGIKDVGNGALIASAKDAGGNFIGLIQSTSPQLRPLSWLGTSDPCSVPEGLRRLSTGFQSGDPGSSPAPRNSLVGALLAASAPTNS